jgi:hypothetical protein
MIDSKFCVRKAFIDIQRLSDYKRQSASSCNCSFCTRKRQQQQKELEYQKTVRLLSLMNNRK